MCNTNINKEIIKKIDILIKFSALNIIYGKDFREQVKILAKVGLTPKEIADLTGKTANNISVTLNKIKRSKGK